MFYCRQVQEIHLLKKDQIAPGALISAVHQVQGDFSTQVKRTEGEADLLHLSSDKVKKKWSYTSLSPCDFMLLTGKNVPLPSHIPMAVVCANGYETSGSIKKQLPFPLAKQLGYQHFKQDSTVQLVFSL